MGRSTKLRGNGSIFLGAIRPKKKKLRSRSSMENWRVLKDNDIATLVESHDDMLQALKLEKCSGFSTLGIMEIAPSCKLILKPISIA